jgi:hypothetical protein
VSSRSDIPDGLSAHPLACWGRQFFQGNAVVSVDQYRQELRAQMDRAETYGATEILINGGELCRTLGAGITATDACSKAMRGELKPGDIVFIDAGADVGMTVKYLLPRAS